ncbi:MAG: hypothetical protein LUE89_07650 [Clostridiales bacterium]|nr:hypothetical protein [Clostridiales bacterium]
MTKLWHNRNRKKMDALFFCAKGGRCWNAMQSAAQKSPKDRPQQRVKSGEKKKFL